MENKEIYDFLIVGAGLYGSVMAHELNKAGYKVLIVDKRNHVGGNVYTEYRDNIDVHIYGAHIFHTSSKQIWDYVKDKLAVRYEPSAIRETDSLQEDGLDSVIK